MSDTDLSTGLPGLDRMLKGLFLGDNIVWLVDSIADYKTLTAPYCERARATGKRLIYFRFARHEPIVSDEMAARLGIEVHVLSPEKGFETFLTGIHKTIEEAGWGAYYVFDCLSDLAVDWHSDQMLGNFFMLTCPFLYDLGTITYFSLLRNYHSFHATTPIAETTQLLLEVYRHSGDLYIHPLKVQHRYSPTMHMIHVRRGDDFLPVTESSTIAEIRASVPWSGIETGADRLSVWSRTFMQAEEALEAVKRGEQTAEKAGEFFNRLLRMVITRDERVIELARKYLTLADLIEIKKRMIGTGLIGGKSVGMLLARAILKRANPRWNDLLEVHDSFFIGSDVFYTFLVRNGVWWVREKQKSPATFLEGSERARQNILRGNFPDYMVRQFSDMLDYFGQSPIIVRSSSLLEDNFGNAFAGKYESVFCPNQGPRAQCLENFMSAVRAIYASSMSEKALRYRAQRGILDRDEQMALLVQRVSGSLQGTLYYPQIAGVGFSFNPYAWSKDIDPQAGMLRLVFGLGTRAVDRSDDDYTRIVALNAPERRPDANMDDAKRYAQRKVDVLDLQANRLTTNAFDDVARQSPNLPLELFASRDEELSRFARERNRSDIFPWMLTFDRLLTKTEFIGDMREMLAILHRAYDYPVDVEFAANQRADGSLKINVVQCRPLQVKEGGTIVAPPANIAAGDVILEARGAVIGHSRLSAVDRVIYVPPSFYGQMPVNDRYAVARLIGRIVHLQEPHKPKCVMLVGPGRWGTTTPSLGVPVSFAEINAVSIVCEIVAMRDDLIPDVSLGTHFFSDLVEMDILYLALFPQQEGNRLNDALLVSRPNRLLELAPESAALADVVRVIDTAELDGGRVLRLNANTLKQKVVCYLETAEEEAETSRPRR